MADDSSQSGGAKPQELSTDPELRPIQRTEAEAKRDEAAATARKVAAEADKVAAEVGKAEADAFSSAFPKGTAKPLEGTLEIGDEVGLVGDLIAHSMMRRAGEEIRNQLRDLLSKEETRILLVSSPDLIGSDWPYMAIGEQLRQHRQELEQVKASLAPPPPDGMTPPPSEEESEEEPQAEMRTARGAIPFAVPAAASNAVQGVSSLVGGVAEVAALFRSDYEIAASKVSVGASPLLAAVAHFLIELVKEVNVEGFSLLKQSELFLEFTAAANLRLEVQRLAAGLKESRVTPADRRIEWAKEARASYVEALTAEKPPGYAELKPLRERMTGLQEKVSTEADDVAPERARVGVAEAVVQRFDSFATSLLKPPEKGYPPLIAAAIRERLHHRTKGYTHVLYAGVDTAGGESVARRTFLKSSIRFIGGAQVTYLLWDVKEERLVAADTRPFLAATKMRLGSGFAGGAETVPLG